MLTTQPLLRGHRTRSSSVTLPPLLTALLLSLCSMSLLAQRATIAARALTSSTADTVSTTDSTIVDAGTLPGSQPLTVTIRVAPTPERAAALDELLAAPTAPSSPGYPQWLTPQQFAASYGATDDQLAALKAWATSQGLSVAAVSTGKTRLPLSGTADQVQHAFAISLRHYLVSG